MSWAAIQGPKHALFSASKSGLCSHGGQLLGMPSTLPGRCFERPKKAWNLASGHCPSSPQRTCTSGASKLPFRLRAHSHSCASIQLTELVLILCPT